MAPPIRRDAAVMALDIETDCNRCGGREKDTDGGCNEKAVRDVTAFRTFKSLIFIAAMVVAVIAVRVQSRSSQWQRITVAAGVTYLVLGDLDMMRKTVLPRRKVNRCVAPPAQIGVTQCTLQIASVIEAVLIALSPERQHIPR